MSDAQRQMCWVAELTPAGRGAVATIAVWGVAATQLLQDCFKPRGRAVLSATPPGSVRFGNWCGSGQHSEEVVVCRCAADEWEVHCHGGRAAPAAIIESLVCRGALVCNSTDWLVRRSVDTLEIESQIALATATTERTAAILLDQSRGALRDCITRIVEFLNCGDTASARRTLSRLRQLSGIGLHLCRPYRVAVVGPANAGKSSLVNRLSGFQRSIVMDEPGTTRDVLAARAAFDGWPVELIDTAGIRAARDPVERQGVELAVQQARDADLAILVFDAASLEAASFGAVPVPGPVLCPDALSRPSALGRPDALPRLDAPTESHAVMEFGELFGCSTEPDQVATESGAGICPDQYFNTTARANRSWLFVANKVDLCTESAPPCDVQVSAKTGQGIAELTSLMLRRLTSEVVPLPGEAVPFRQRHVDAIAAAGKLLESGDLTNASRVLVEFLAFPPSGELR